MLSFIIMSASKSDVKSSQELILLIVIFVAIVLAELYYVFLRRRRCVRCGVKFPKNENGRFVCSEHGRIVSKRELESG